MPKYRKTALVEAEQFVPASHMIPAGCYVDKVEGMKADFWWYLKTLEGVHEMRVGDYVCTGPAGERWNVSREIFEATYERVLDAD